MNLGQTRTRLVTAGAALTAVALIAGCGSTYRSVVTPIQQSGPTPQPSSFVAVVSASSTSAPGIATLVDYSGDTIMAQAPIGPGPLLFALDGTGTTGYTVNSDSTLTNFPVNSSSLQAKNVTYSTLAGSANPIGLFAPVAGLWAADLAGSDVDVFTSSPATLKLTIPVAPVPVMVIGATSIGERNYAISQVIDSNGTDCNTAPAAVAQNGLVTPIEISQNTADTAIAVGKCPVYALPSSDGRRLFVLNRGSDTVSVINIQTNTLDSCTPFANQSGQTVNCHPLLPLSTAAVTATGIAPPNGTTGMTSVAGPVYAEYNTATSQLVVANYDGSTISIIDVSLDEYGNDSATFGTTYTVKVGNNPAAVTVLYDGSRAYTANQTDGTVTVVNLSSRTVEKGGASALPVMGHPRSISSTQNSEYGKVYVSSPDSNFLTILTTTTDLVDTTIPVEGNIVDMHTTTQNGSSGNAGNVSRKPGYGLPCYLPDTATTKYSASLATCQAMPVPAS
jgi:DNA-binding beta-propeller fold protein YncE